MCMSIYVCESVGMYVCEFVCLRVIEYAHDESVILGFALPTVQ